MMMRLWAFTLGAITGIIAAAAVALGVTAACYWKEVRRS